MVKVKLLVGVFLVLSIGICFCQLQLQTLDNARVRAIDDEVRDLLNATLTNEAVDEKQQLDSAIESFNAQCNQEIDDLLKECMECASTVCPQNVLQNPNKLKSVISKLKLGIRKSEQKIEKKVKNIARIIGLTDRNVWHGIKRKEKKAVFQGRFPVGLRVTASGTVSLRKLVRGVKRVIRRVGSAIRRIGRAIRRIRFRFRRWGKRNTEMLPDCALTCQPCMTLRNGDIQEICGRNNEADKLVARLNLIEAAMNATKDRSAPIIAKIELNGKVNDMFYNETYVTSNILGVARVFQSPLPMPVFGDFTAFADSLAEEVWKLFKQWYQ